MKKISFLSVCVAAVMFTACNSGTTDDNSSDSTMLGSNDTTNTGLFNTQTDAASFVEDAATGGILEVDLGKIAAEKGMRQDVKDFGQRMVDDHTKINNDLMDIAQSRNMNIPTALDDSQRDDVKDLSDKTGADFDKAYVDKMVKDHKNDIDKFQKAADNLEDSTLKNFAIRTLPILKEHYEAIQKIQNEIEK